MAAVCGTLSTSYACSVRTRRGTPEEATLHHGHRVVFAFRVVAVVRDDSFAGAYEQIDEVPTHKPAASCDHDGAHTWPLTRDGNQ